MSNLPVEERFLDGVILVRDHSGNLYVCNALEVEVNDKYELEDVEQVSAIWDAYMLKITLNGDDIKYEYGLGNDMWFIKAVVVAEFPGDSEIAKEYRNMRHIRPIDHTKYRSPDAGKLYIQAGRASSSRHDWRNNA
jgi:hypothetical protein